MISNYRLMCSHSHTHKDILWKHFNIARDQKRVPILLPAAPALKHDLCTQTRQSRAINYI